MEEHGIALVPDFGAEGPLLKETKEEMMGKMAEGGFQDENDNGEEES